MNRQGAKTAKKNRVMVAQERRKRQERGEYFFATGRHAWRVRHSYLVSFVFFVAVPPGALGVLYVGAAAAGISHKKAQNSQKGFPTFLPLPLCRLCLFVANVP